MFLPSRHRNLALPGEARLGLEKADMLTTLEVIAKHPQEKEAACPPAYCIMPLACAATVTLVAASRRAACCSPSTNLANSCAAPAAAQPTSGPKVATHAPFARSPLAR